MEFLKTASNGLPVAAEELSDVANTAVSKLAGFDRRVGTTIAFAQGTKHVEHGSFDIERILGKHGGILPVFPALLR
jgi:hypothetical protein